MNENLSKKNYAKYDRTFMAFGSIANAMQGQLKDEKDWDKIWNWAKKRVAELVDELYEAENGSKETAL